MRTVAQFTIIVDTREQTPFDFGSDWPVERGTLMDADYSIKGLTDLVAIDTNDYLIKGIPYVA